MSYLTALIPEWQQRANCDGVPTNYFYPEKGDSARAALRVCRNCEVKQECLEWAIERREPGVWGGTTEPQRRRLTRPGRAAA